MKTLSLVLLFVFALMLLTACAPEANALLNTPDSDGEVAGFWKGLWHGIISPIMFFVSLINKNVAIYEVHNNGGWYNFGFILGVSMVFGGSGAGSTAAKR